MTDHRLILLAATLADARRVSPDMLAVTPRSTARVRGRSALHMYATTEFEALPGDVRARVIAVAYPAIAASACERCHGRWGSRDHEIRRQP